MKCGCLFGVRFAARDGYDYQTNEKGTRVRLFRSAFVKIIYTNGLHCDQCTLSSAEHQMLFRKTVNISNSKKNSSAISSNNVEGNNRGPTKPTAGTTPRTTPRTTPHTNAGVVVATNRLQENSAMLRLMHDVDLLKGALYSVRRENELLRTRVDKLEKQAQNRS